MKPNSKGILTVSIVILLSLTTNQIVPAAWGQNTDKSLQDPPAATRLATRVTQWDVPATRPLRWAPDPPKPQATSSGKGNTWKWIAIAVGGAVGAAFIAKGGKGGGPERSTSSSIVIGIPSVERPQ